MRNIKIIIEYDGKNFAGWQIQPGKASIQGEMQRALKDVTGEDIEIIASGRTDAGVHAYGQTANFKTNSKVPIQKIPYALNAKLPKSIVVKSAEEVDEKLHQIMINIHNNAYDTAVKFGAKEGDWVNYVAGANIAGFVKVANAMVAQGLV